MFINRDWNRTEHDDFELNIKTRMSENSEAVPMYVGDKIVGWTIRTRYE